MVGIVFWENVLAQQQQERDPTNDLLLGVGFVIAVIVGVWYFYSDVIAKYYLTLKLYQMRLLGFTFDGQTFNTIKNAILTRDLKSWTAGDMFSIGAAVGLKFNVIYLLICAPLIWKLYTKSPAGKLKRVLNMNTLKESECRIWPYIYPVVGVDLLNEPMDKGPFSMGLTPLEFAQKYKLLKEVGSSEVEPDKVRNLFIAQLGRPWRGINSLRSHEKALLAVMAAHGAGDKKGAMAAVNEMATSVKNKTSDLKNMPNFTAAKKLYKYLERDDVKEVFDKHAYVYTVFYDMMLYARKTGVFPSAYFVWLKPRDRVLFYTLNNVGRNVAFVEVAGIVAHYRAEKSLGQKILNPMVETAVQGYQEEMKTVKIPTKS